MKASELVEIINKTILEKGDVDVYILDCYSYYTVGWCDYFEDITTPDGLYIRAKEIMRVNDAND